MRMWWFNRQRNGYRMACKPPECRQLRPPHRFPARARIPPCPEGCERTRERSRAAPGWSCRVVAGLSTRPARAGHCRRNAVGRVGVKLDAAPDAPHWGKVLVRTPSDRFSGARMCAASTFTCLSREHPGCPADIKPRSRWPASSGGGRRRGRKTSWLSAGLRIAEHSAWAGCQADKTAETVRTTRQRTTRDRTSGRDPHPGKDPL